MPRNGSGTFSLVANALAIPSSTASSTFFNNTLNDFASTFTTSLASDGQTPLTGALKGYAGTVSNPSWTFSADATTGWYQSATGKLTAAIGGVKGIEQDSTGFSDGAAATIASAATTNLASTPSGNITISGTTTITAFGTAADGVKKAVTFSGILTLTHNATSLILPGAANITTAAGDSLIAKSLGSGNWKVIAYTKADGTSVVASGVTSIVAGTGINVSGATGAVTITNAGILTKSYDSGDQTITLSGGLTLAHSLSAVPKMVMFFWVCRSTELNYSAGDEVVASPLMAGVGASNMGFAAWSDSTNVNIRFSSSAVSIPNKTSGASSVITTSNWRLIARAYA